MDTVASAEQALTENYEPSRDGLSEAEAAARLAARGPSPKPASSRSYTSIVRANVLTVFNAILAAFGAVTLVFGDARDVAAFALAGVRHFFELSVPTPGMILTAAVASLVAIGARDSHRGRPQLRRVLTGSFCRWLGALSPTPGELG
jgi:hypothetical protein